MVERSSAVAVLADRTRTMQLPLWLNVNPQDECRPGACRRSVGACHVPGSGFEIRRGLRPRPPGMNSRAAGPSRAGTRGPISGGRSLLRSPHVHDKGRQTRAPSSRGLGGCPGSGPAVAREGRDPGFVAPFPCWLASVWCRSPRCRVPTTLPPRRSRNTPACPTVRFRCTTSRFGPMGRSTRFEARRACSTLQETRSSSCAPGHGLDR